jgi:hypothetical protein
MRHKESNRMRLWLLRAFFLFGLLWPRQGSGCSLLVLPPIEVDPEEFVFIGTVTELTELPGHGPERDPTDPVVGVRVRVRESILRPRRVRASEEYVVHPFSLGIDCAKNHKSKQWILEDYAPGTEVWVIARKLDSGSDIDLEVWEGDGAYMVPNTKPLTSAKSVSDYRKIKASLLPEFELRKDLLRLHQSSSDREREKILMRLAFYPGYRSREERFLALVNSTIKTRKSVERVLRVYRTGA